MDKNARKYTNIVAKGRMHANSSPASATRKEEATERWVFFFSLFTFFYAWSYIRVDISIYCFRLCKLPSIRTSGSIVEHTDRLTVVVCQQRYTSLSPPINKYLQNDSHIFSQNSPQVKKHTPKGVPKKCFPRFRYHTTPINIPTRGIRGEHLLPRYFSSCEYRYLSHIKV